MGKPNKENFRAYWNLDEASGNAIDALGNHDLTETSGTIASAEGGRDFEAGDTEWFEKLDHADLSFADAEFTVGGWLKPESSNTDMAMIAKWKLTSNYREYALLYINGAGFRFTVSNNGTNQTTVTDTAIGAVSNGSLYFVMAWHDPVADKIYVSVNNNTPNEAAHSTGCNDNVSRFSIGAWDVEGTPARFYDGIMWSAFVYAGLMTADERTSMYNDGTPLKWIDFGPPKIKTINGVAIGSAKTVSGISVASIKSIQGIT
jgi:hypothetical protein